MIHNCLLEYKYNKRNPLSVLQPLTSVWLAWRPTVYIFRGVLEHSVTLPHLDRERRERQSTNDVNRKISAMYWPCALRPLDKRPSQKYEHLSV